MKTKAALVGANSRVEFNTEAPIDHHISPVIAPGNPELDHPFWLYKTV
jgi:hypothetical protein